MEETAKKTIFYGVNTSVGRFYEKRQYLTGALEGYSKALQDDPDNTRTYIDRSRVHLKMGNITQAQEDTNIALSLIEDNVKPKSPIVSYRSPELLSYYACIQKAEVLYANGEFELALMYFHRANKIKPQQPNCVEGIRKATEILECTICSPHAKLTISGDLNFFKNEEKSVPNIRSRPPIRRQSSTPPVVLTEYSKKEANRLLIEIAKDRKLLLNLCTDLQPIAGFTGLQKAKEEARQAIFITEAQLKFLDKAECLHVDEQKVRSYLNCLPGMDRLTLIRFAEEELMHLQKLSSKEKSMEILYRAMKVINCLKSDDSLLDMRSRLMLAEAYRLAGRSYTEIKIFDQGLENYTEAHRILFPLKDQGCLYRATFDIARCYISANKYEEAILSLQEMMNEAISDNERSFVCQQLGFCYLGLEDIQKAKKHAVEALDYASSANEELMVIEANILLGKIYLKSSDFQRAEEYIIYALSLKDQLGDLENMEHLDELLLEIKKLKKDIFQQKYNQFIPENIIQVDEPRWLSSIMQNENNKLQSDTIDKITIDSQYDKQEWRMLTPYYRLFDLSLERMKNRKTGRRIDTIQVSINDTTSEHSKQTI
ncbi:unnamed protein product [Didymodactylos carnosus]|uniref:Outer dynein arm-docking complex subunit 4 n=1 Tax=Didymodactylos carnosus TaxID=1234261 RepID=A0A814CA13_9BILA|nr:unnamed protein product [Didymodactylos carnosus]CAF1246282.1 unnamed protein product [Didymodactylos carnosus]CAF3714335.1 unnamed protein product [Didymodactylos carnosus]CAF4053915.1 unnamed protein product [Didymodactylos carnosus]